MLKLECRRRTSHEPHDIYTKPHTYDCRAFDFGNMHNVFELSTRSLPANINVAVCVLEEINTSLACVFPSSGFSNLEDGGRTCWGNYDVDTEIRTFFYCVAFFSKHEL
jgi:hypothetical protein